jgi:hypothetical protein
MIVGMNGLSFGSGSEQLCCLWMAFPVSGASKGKISAVRL